MLCHVSVCALCVRVPSPHALCRAFSANTPRSAETRCRGASASCQRTGNAFREDFDKYPLLWKRLEHQLCPRVHMKIIAIDSEIVYIGSANMTGAGMGMKSAANRNFEAGILTDEPGFIDSAMSHFDRFTLKRSIWSIRSGHFSQTHYFFIWHKWQNAV